MGAGHLGNGRLPQLLGAGILGQDVAGDGAVVVHKTQALQPLLGEVRVGAWVVVRAGRGMGKSIAGLDHRVCGVGRRAGCILSVVVFGEVIVKGPPAVGVRLASLAVVVDAAWIGRYCWPGVVGLAVAGGVGGAANGGSKRLQCAA